ncbi:MAG TPA: DUF222 domain-containing protein [Gammaproteobacteria bacterium]|nr:DUF222 domain-containing protein [Gammaproteobacteria bacterium]
MSVIRPRSAFESLGVSSSHDELSVDELDATIGRLARQMNADSYRMLVLVRDFDDRFGYAKWSFKTCAEWLAWRCGLSPSAAREKVRAAQALRRLPAISRAFADGRLSYSKVRALTRVAHEHDEDLLLAYAVNAAVPEVEERCRQLRNVQPESVAGARRAWERRGLSLWRDEGRGTMRLTVEVPIEDGELIAKAIDCAVAAGEVSTGVEPDIGGETKSAAWRAQQADALVAVVKAYLDGGGAGGEGSATADRYQVVVHVDETALREGAGRSDLPLDTVRRLTCDGSVLTVVEDERGQPLDVGRKQRTVSTALKRALYARDRRCSFPGCQRHRYLDAHHLQHWADGGDTSLDNLTLLCTHHHRLLHEGGFRIEREGDGALRFLTVDGRTIPRGGYRLEDFTDDDCMADTDAEGDTADTAEDASRDAFCTRTVQQPASEVREPGAVYRITRTRAAT